MTPPSPDDTDAASPASPSASSTTEAVTFDSAGVTLQGTLWLPDQQPPHPGVVLVHGSGPLSRAHEVAGQLGMQFGFSVPVFTELAEALSAAGYAVLSYDKRTCGPFNNCAENDYPRPPESLQITAFVRDAAAAIDALAQHDDLAASATAVVGLSQGATFVPYLLAADGGPVPVVGDLRSLPLAAGIMVAAPHGPIDELLADQAATLRQVLAELGASEEQIDESVGQLSQLADDVADIRGGDGDGPPVGGASRRFWSSWMELGDTAPEVATQLDESLLVLGGTLDWNVRPPHLEAWRTTLSDKEDADVVILPCVTHALTCVDEQDPAAMTADDFGREVHDEVVATMLSFLDRHLKPAA